MKSSESILRPHQAPLSNIHTNRKVELRPYLSVMLDNVVFRFILNKRLSARSGGHETEEELFAVKNFKEITHEIALCLSAFYPGDFIPALKWLGPQRLEKRFKECNKRMDSFVSKIIAEHEAERKLGAIVEEEKDMVHVLLDEMEKSEEEHRIIMTNVKAILWLLAFIVPALQTYQDPRRAN
ncbi:hypothetical protein KC19_9G131600 [Ceratodon purpureus]|uniref:Cytochrome P450 n=1 Tax=Ceratodon purpureus TaxID=3225 RepID=A0A8T0GTM1_CERPU|nr:hypothetical protein KC19_9G131600 [Ceratodon purpureus]